MAAPVALSWQNSSLPAVSWPNFLGPGAAIMEWLGGVSGIWWRRQISDCRVFLLTGGQKSRFSKAVYSSPCGGRFSHTLCI